MHNSLKRVLTGIAAMLFFSVSMLVQATEKGLFWKMESPSGQISYLFGTIHTDDNRVTNFSPSLLAALNSVDMFVMETQPNSNPAHFSMQQGSLKTLLTEAEIERVRALADFHVMHLDHALRMKPWLLAIVFSQSKPQTPYAQDNLLMRGAEDFSKPVKGLETSEEHFGLIDSFSLDEQLVMLRAALNMTEAEKAQSFEQLITVYLEGSSDEILALDTKITSSSLPKTLWEKMRVKLLDERNVLMAQRAIKLAQNQSVFIAVGAGHLAGESGFISAFEEAGYTFTSIKN
jgi:uncharacterized protein